jgi:hypothetical protein
MRLSAGGCYEIAGIQVRRAMDGPPETIGLARWQERQADLWAESATIAHVHRHLTAEENGLWNAMWKELEAIAAAITRLDGEAPAPPAP